MFEYYEEEDISNQYDEDIQLYEKLFITYFYIYQYFEIFIEVIEVIIWVIMLIIYSFYFIKRILNGWFQTEYEINFSLLILKYFMTLISFW